MRLKRFVCAAEVRRHGLVEFARVERGAALRADDVAHRQDADDPPVAAAFQHGEIDEEEATRELLAVERAARMGTQPPSSPPPTLEADDQFPST